MEKTYSKGDLVLISKSAYGTRIPFTSISVLSKPVKRNDVILARVSRAGYSAKVLSRCVGMPGDTVISLDEQLIINSKPAVTPPTLLPTYNKGKGLSKLEAYLLTENQGATENSLPEGAISYNIIVPKSGLTVAIDSTLTIPLYEVVFADENGEKSVFIKDNKLYIDNQEQTHYQFKEDYYWVLSDNREMGVDSRNFGFVSQKDIDGKAIRAWLNCNFFSHD